MEVGLYHFVYSSLRGYETLYLTPQLKGAMKNVLEALALRLYPKARGGVVITGALRFPLGGQPGGALYLRAFPHGSDRGGRPRSCVHAVLVPPWQAAAVPLFHAFHLPSAALVTDRVPLQTVGSWLPAQYDFPDFSPGKNFFPRLRAAPDWLVAMLLTVLLVPDRATFLFAEAEEIAPLLEELGVLLPPGVRARAGFLGGLSPADAEPFCTGAVWPFEPVRLVLVRPGSAAPESILQQHVLWDLLSGRTNELLPKELAYARLCAELLSSPQGKRRLGKLLGFLELYDCAAVHSPAQYGELVRLFAELENQLDESGGFPEGGADTWLRRAHAVAAAGLYLGAAKALTEALKKTGDRPETAPLHSAVAELHASALRGESQLDATVAHLAGQIGKLCLRKPVPAVVPRKAVPEELKLGLSDLADEKAAPPKTGDAPVSPAAAFDKEPVSPGFGTATLLGASPLRSGGGPFPLISSSPREKERPLASEAAKAAPSGPAPEGAASSYQTLLSGSLDDLRPEGAGKMFGPPTLVGDLQVFGLPGIAKGRGESTKEEKKPLAPPEEEENPPDSNRFLFEP